MAQCLACGGDCLALPNTRNFHQSRLLLSPQQQTSVIQGSRPSRVTPILWVLLVFWEKWPQSQPHAEDFYPVPLSPARPSWLHVDCDNLLGSLSCWPISNGLICCLVSKCRNYSQNLLFFPLVQSVFTWLNQEKLGWSPPALSYWFVYLLNGILHMVASSCTQSFQLKLTTIKHI